jgi:hypothetical protein
MRLDARAPLSALIASMVIGVMVASPPQLAIIGKRIRALGGPEYDHLTVVGAIKKVLSASGENKVQRIFLAVVAFAIIATFIAALVATVKLMTAGREGGALFVSAVLAAVLMLALAGMVL